MARVLVVALAAALAMVLGAAPSRAQYAYITNEIDGTVSVINPATNGVIGGPIAVGTMPEGVAVTPDGSKVYVTNFGSNSVSVIDTATNSVVGPPIAVGSNPLGVAATPDTTTVYVANSSSNTVSVIATASNTVIGNPIAVDAAPFGVAVTPDGSMVYVTNYSSNTVSVIATATNTVVGPPISVGTHPIGVAVTPDGSTVYVANSSSNTISVIATASNTVIGGPIPVGNSPSGVAVSPDGSTVYVANQNDNTVSVIATASNTVIGGPITVGNDPIGLAVTLDGSEVYVANANSNTVSVIATASNTVIGGPITVGTAPAPLGIFIVPPTLLSVGEAGSGAGLVTSSPVGVNCSAGSKKCLVPFANGTQVTLTASASAGSSFMGWSGGGCGGIGTCTVTLSANTTVAATFLQNSAANLTLVAAVLPTSRSVQVGSTATAFATMIDAGPANASTCTIAPATGIPASFVFQTTDPTTNALNGTPNTPVNIAAGQAQSFVIALTPTAAFPPTTVAFTFTCANATNPAASIVGVDTLNLSASTTPVPDVVALAASGDPGYVDIPGATGTGVFAVATVNLGVDATITATANTGTANLPVTLAVCQTNPSSGACLAAAAPTVTMDIQPNATPTFGIFVTGSAAVANSPGVNRVFVTFTDSGGVLRGETSVAVRTQ
jgi:YVTN family beta-propeller protein